MTNVVALAVQRPAEVLPQEGEPAFEILRCIADVAVDSDSGRAEYSVLFHLKKVRDGDDRWTQAFAGGDLLEWRTVRNPRGETLRASRSEREGRVFFDIDLEPLEVGDESEFTVEYRRSVAATQVSMGPLHRSVLYSFKMGSVNYCHHFEWRLRCATKRAKIVHAIPQNEGGDGDYFLAREQLPPNEHNSIALLVNYGVLDRRAAGVVEKMSWTVIGSGIGLLLQAFFT